jgi:hypothetical protein
VKDTPLEGITKALAALMGGSENPQGATPWKLDEEPDWPGKYQPGRAVKVLSMSLGAASVRIGDVGILRGNRLASHETPFLESDLALLQSGIRLACTKSTSLSATGGTLLRLTSSWTPRGT